MKRDKNFYKKFKGKELSITDAFALDRTILANERNLLTFIRTFLSFFITGLGVIKFVPAWASLGFIFMFVAIIFLIVGIFRYKNMKEELLILQNIDEPDL